VTDNNFIEEMKAIGNLTEEERALLVDMDEAVSRHIPAIVDAFYNHLHKFDNLNKMLNAEPGRVQRLKGHLGNWLATLTAGVYDAEYFEKRYRIGKRHVEVGLEPRYVVAAMTFCRGFAAQRIVREEYADDPQKEARMTALNRVMDIDLNIMLQSYDDYRVKQFLEVTGFSEGLLETLMAGE
jgi:hypothetical protein